MIPSAAPSTSNYVRDTFRSAQHFRCSRAMNTPLVVLGGVQRPFFCVCKGRLSLHAAIQ